MTGIKRKKKDSINLYRIFFTLTNVPVKFSTRATCLHAAPIPVTPSGFCIWRVVLAVCMHPHTVLKCVRVEQVADRPFDASKVASYLPSVDLALLAFVLKSVNIIMKY
jgi:hypothetical protein